LDLAREAGGKMYGFSLVKNATVYRPREGDRTKAMEEAPDDKTVSRRNRN